MWRGARALPASGRGLSLDRIIKSRYSVMAKVTEGQRELDSFQASSPEGLRAALRPIYRHIDPRSQMMRFVGVEEHWLPGGFRSTRREVNLPDLNAALDYLAC